MDEIEQNVEQTSGNGVMGNDSIGDSSNLPNPEPGPDVNPDVTPVEKINNKFIIYNTQTAFEADNNANKINNTSIVFVKDSKNIYTHGTQFNCAPDDADEEDLTIVDGKLKFADKDYVPGDFSGLGRVYLRKNIVDNKNYLRASDLSSANTIYIIQYDFDLDDLTVQIPANCVLKFEGGSISNGTLTGNNTLLDGYVNISAALSGTFKHNNVVNACGTTTNRPTLGAGDAGFIYCDTTIKTIVFWDGTNWSDVRNLTTSTTENTEDPGNIEVENNEEE